MSIQRRNWVPDPATIADQLIKDYRGAYEHQGPTSELESVKLWVAEGNSDALSTIISWQATAKEHGEQFQEDDCVALVQELACRATGLTD